MQEVDAERRIQILRGLPIDPSPPPLDLSEEKTKRREEKSQRREGHDDPRRDRKRRKLVGEDDTDRDIRLAQERTATAPSKDLILNPPNSTSTSLTDKTGHISLFPEPNSRRQVPKNSEATAEAAAKQREFEDQYTLRFSNAAGFKQAVGQKPWYHNATGNGDQTAEGKDVWGNEDPRRKEREKIRIAADDPLAAMQKGVQGLREVERERKKWNEERERETQELIKAEKRRRRRDKSIDKFSLDAQPHRSHHRHRSDRHSRSHRHRRSSHRSSSPRENSREGTNFEKRSRRGSASGTTTPGWGPGQGGRYSAQFAATA